MKRNNHEKKIIAVVLLVMLGLLELAAQEDLLKELYYPELVRYEATYRNQSIQFPRSSLAHPLTLGKQIDELLGNRSDYDDAYVCIGSWSGISDTIYTSAQSLFETDPVLLAFRADNDGTIQQIYEEPNVSIHLGYDADDGSHRYLTFFIRIRGMVNRVMYARMTFMYPGKEKDNRLTYGSTSAPIVGSYVTAFDAGASDIISADMNYYDSINSSLKSKIESKEQLDDMEYKLLEGVYEKSSNAYDDGYAQWLFEEGRYSDALQFFEKGYLENRGDILSGNEKNRDVYNRCCYQMGNCLKILGVHDKAEYYLGLAALAGGQYEQKYQQLHSEKVTDRDLHNYQYVDAATFDINALSVGQLLNNIYDVIPDFILSGKLRINGSNKTDNFTAAESWNYNIKKLCCEKPSILTLRYSKAKFQTESSVDKSILLYDNTIILSVYKISTNPALWRVNILIPNFRSDDDKKGNTRLNMPLMTSFVISNKDEFHNTKDLQSIYDKCMDLISEHRCGEAMNGLKFVYCKLKQQYEGKKMPTAKKELYQKAGFRYGYTLVELDAPAKAIAYLKPNTEAGGSKERQEYINAIVGLQDIRAYDIVMSELASVSSYLKKHKNDQSYIDYQNFLLRRKAYILIDKEEYDEAESILKSQLEVEKDPEKLKIVEHELQYINGIRSE